MFVKQLACRCHTPHPYHLVSLELHQILVDQILLQCCSHFPAVMLCGEVFCYTKRGRQDALAVGINFGKLIQIVKQAHKQKTGKSIIIHRVSKIQNKETRKGGKGQKPEKTYTETKGFINNRHKTP